MNHEISVSHYLSEILEIISEIFIYVLSKWENSEKKSGTAHKMGIFSQELKSH